MRDACLAKKERVREPERHFLFLLEIFYFFSQSQELSVLAEEDVRKIERRVAD